MDKLDLTRNQWLVNVSRLLLPLLCGLIAACNDSESSNPLPALEEPPAVAEITRVEIQPSATLIHDMSMPKQLRVSAYDKDGRAVSISDVQWVSSRPAVADVDSRGVVTAIASSGSTSITARVGDVSSKPALVMAVQLPPGAVALTDSDIVSDPVVAAAPAGFALGQTVSLRRGTPGLQAGSLLVNTENKSVAGRVLSIEEQGDRFEVRLGVPPLKELLPNLRINEILAFDTSMVSIDPGVAADFDVRRDGNTFTYTPKAPQDSIPKLFRRSDRGRTLSNGDADWRFGNCEVLPIGTLPIRVSVPTPISINADPRLELIYDDGLQRMMVHSEVTATFELGLDVAVTFEGRVECEKPFHTFHIAFPGVIGLFLGGSVPVGIGFEVSGKITAASAALGFRMENRSKPRFGIDCSSVRGCELEGEFPDFVTTKTLNWDIPNIGDVRFEPSVKGYAFIQLSVGHWAIEETQLELAKATIGAKIEGSFAAKSSQVDDRAYKSAYALTAEARAAAGLLNLQTFIHRLGFSVVAIGDFSLADVVVSLPLAQSPKAVDVVSDRDTFQAGDVVTFNARLDPATTGYLGVYNVDRVQLVRVEAGTISADVVSEVAPTVDGQTVFEIPWRADRQGSADRFSVFVVTNALPFELAALELTDRAQPRPSSISVFFTHACAANAVNTVKCWGLNDVGQLGRRPALGNGSSSPEYSTNPQAVNGVSAHSISVGSAHSCAVTAAGRIQCWGNNLYGQLGNGEFSTGDAALGPLEVIETGRFLSVGAGSVHSCGLLVGGRVVCWGRNEAGELGLGSTGGASATPVEVVRNDAKQLSVFGLHTCVLMQGSAQLVRCWGGRYGGQRTVIEGLGPVTAVAAGLDHFCALTERGGVKCWGSNKQGQLGNGNTIDSDLPVDVFGLTEGVIEVKAGGRSTCALLAAGSVKCWGMSLGNGTSAYAMSSRPVDVTGLSSGVAALSVGIGTSCAILSSGAARCWGGDDLGQLGRGGPTPYPPEWDRYSTVPVNVINFP